MTHTNKILSIQSKLVYGYVGSNIAELAIQLHGLDVISLPTVLLSAHTGFKPIHGRAFDKAWFDDLIVGIEAINILDDVSCIISGYIGSEDILSSSVGFLNKLKQKHPDKIYICDPVIGDIDDGLYVPKNVADQLTQTLIPNSDIITPNFFEIEYILGQKIENINDLLEGVINHHILKNKIVIITSCDLADTPRDQLETIIIDKGIMSRIRSRKIDILTKGTGDLFTSLLASKLAVGDQLPPAVEYVSSIISNILEYAHVKGYPEMNADCLTKFITRN